jgi:hypothetical protein
VKGTFNIASTKSEMSESPELQRVLRKKNRERNHSSGVILRYLLI